MISRTIDECRNLEFKLIDYESEEAKIREVNANLIYSLIDISQDDECLSYLSLRKVKNTELPYKMRKFYEVYIDQTKSQTDNKIIISKIKSEIKALNIKISSFAQKWSFEEEYLKNALRTNELLALIFVKDPGKQTFHQHHAAEYIDKLPIVENFSELSSGGPTALYIVNRNIIEGKDKKDQKTGKSIDFKWEYTFKDKTLTFYATHKYTKISGGSQDNQYKDVQEFHELSRNCINPNICLLSITDGSYYLSKDTSIKEQTLTKIEYLNTQFVGNRNLATTTNALMADILPLVEQWLKTNFKADIEANETNIKNELMKIEILKSIYKTDKA